MQQTATKPNVFWGMDEGTDKVLRSLAIGSTGQKLAVDEKIMILRTASGGIPVSAESGSMLRMQSKISKLERMVTSLTSKLANLEKCFVQNSIDEIEIRDIPYAQAKREIRQFFKDHHGEKYTASDLEDHLKIDFEMALEICSELEKEGKIG
jgi:hypothetical protein